MNFFEKIFYTETARNNQSVSVFLKEILDILYSHVMCWYKPLVVTVVASWLMNCQDLSGYVTPSRTKNLSFLNFDLLLVFLGDHLAQFQSYGISSGTKVSIVECLMHCVSIECLNTMMTVKDFCNCKSGMQVQYNILRLVDWFKEVNEFPLHLNFTSRIKFALDGLLQACKLVQMGNSVLFDFDSLLASFHRLSPSQIVRLLLNNISSPGAFDVEFLSHQIDVFLVNKFAMHHARPSDDLIVSWNKIETCLVLAPTV